jgi:hypothetical protein
LYINHRYLRWEGSSLHFLTVTLCWGLLKMGTRLMGILLVYVDYSVMVPADCTGWIAVAYLLVALEL